MNTKQMKRQISTLIRCMLIVLTVTVLTVSGAGAEGFFSGVFTQTVDTTENSTTLFSRNSGTASITRGYGYDDMSGRQADHVTEYREYGETQYIWEHVDESSLMEYGDFLLRKGFEVIDFGAGSYTTSVYGICNEALYFDFLLAYEWDRQMLMLVFYSDHVNDDDSWNAGYDSGDDDWYAGYDSGNDGYDADYFFMNDQSGSGFFRQSRQQPRRQQCGFCRPERPGFLVHRLRRRKMFHMQRAGELQV